MMRRLWLILALACSVNIAHAGQVCEVKKANPASFIKSIQLAEKTRDALDQSDAQVALIARVGQDLSHYGLRYSHMAYVWRDHPQGRWLVVHELNQCGTASSALFNEGLANFFMDVYAYDTEILIPSPQSQARIVAMLASATTERLHSDHYNMLAYAFSSEYQNSNQWVLETYAASASEFPLGDRDKAQAWLKMAGYQPLTIDVSATERLGARMFRANIAFDDHPFGRRMAGKIDTVTVDSVLRFMHQRDPAARDVVVSMR